VTIVVVVAGRAVSALSALGKRMFCGLIEKRSAIHGFWASNHASAIRPGVAFFRLCDLV